MDIGYYILWIINGNGNPIYLEEKKKWWNEIRVPIPHEALETFYEIFTGNKEKKLDMIKSFKFQRLISVLLANINIWYTNDQ